MEKLTVPGCALVDVPLGVLTLSQSAPGRTEAVQLTAVGVETLTRNELPALPGTPPADIWNWAPTG
jgi:hypothetical protein